MNIELRIDGKIFTGIFLNVTLSNNASDILHDNVHTLNLAIDSFERIPCGKVGYLKIDNGRAFCGNVKMAEEARGVVSMKLAGKPDAIQMYKLQNDCADNEIDRSCNIFEL